MGVLDAFIQRPDAAGQTMDVTDLFNKLRINPKNPRLIKSDDFEGLKQSLRTFPKMLEKRKIIYDKQFMIIGGTRRYQAIQTLLPEGFILKHEYFDSAENFTPEEIRQFIVLDNKSAGDWDYDILANEYTVEELGGWGMDPTEWETEPEAEAKQKPEAKEIECPSCKTKFTI